MCNGFTEAREVAQQKNSALAAFAAEWRAAKEAILEDEAWGLTVDFYDSEDARGRLIHDPACPSCREYHSRMSYHALLQPEFDARIAAMDAKLAAYAKRLRPNKTIGPELKRVEEALAAWSWPDEIEHMLDAEVERYWLKGQREALREFIGDYHAFGADALKAAKLARKRERDRQDAEDRRHGIVRRRRLKKEYRP
jgi:hypothetical protein